MQPSLWQPPIEPSVSELAILKRIKRAKLFVFLREHRHELFDAAFQQELAGLYQTSRRGQPPIPPALLALATILQAYTGASDDEVIEAMTMDRRWQLVLDWVDAQEPPLSKGTLIAFRKRLIQTQMDRRLIERTIELAHSFVARRRGLPVKSITLFIFGGVSNIEREPTSPGVEFQMAVVGPLTSLLIGVVCFLLQLPLRGSNSPLEGILFYLAVTNVLLGLFNLIPGFPLDGGRVLHSIIWKLTGSMRQATRAATIVGQIIAYLFIFGGIWLFFIGNFLDGIWLGFIGWFLLSAAQSANSQAMLTSVFKGVTVGEVMNPKPATVPANISLQQLVDAYFLPGGLRYALVMQGEKLVGMITLSDIRHIPRERWGQVPVSQAMIPLERLHVVSPEQSLNDVLPLMAGGDVNQLPVVQDGTLVGILSRDAIVHYLEVRRSLGVESSKSDAQNQFRNAA